MVDKLTSTFNDAYTDLMMDLCVTADDSHIEMCEKRLRTVASPSTLMDKH